MNLKNKKNATETNWVVITGAPSSGKTSVIDRLAALGYATQGEIARAVIERHLKTGRTLAEIRGDGVKLQREMLREKVDLEASLDPAALIFMDRGLPDSMTYFRGAGADTKEVADASAVLRYRAVFLFDRLPMVTDDVRCENEETAALLDRELEADYRALGYEPVRVPVISIEARVKFVLDALVVPAARVNSRN